MTNVAIPEMNMLKNSSTLAVSVPINLPIKLGFVYVHSPNESYFVDALSIDWFQSQAALLQYRIQKLVPLYDKCRNSESEYVEK